MTYRIKLSVVFAFVFSLNLIAQTPNVNLDDNGFKIWSYGSLVNDNAAVNGSQYYQKDFLEAKVSGLGDEAVQVRYNAAKDELEFKKDEKVYEMFKTDSLVVNVLRGFKVFKVLEYTYKGETKKGFLIAKTDYEKVNFLTKEVITYVPFKDAVNAYSESVPAHYRHDKNINFIEVDSKVTEMPTKKKALLKLFPGKESKVESYLKESKVDFSKDADLLNLVNFLNTL